MFPTPLPFPSSALENFFLCLLETGSYSVALVGLDLTMESAQADSEHVILLPRPPGSEVMGAYQPTWRFSDAFALGKKGNPEPGIS